VLPILMVVALLAGLTLLPASAAGSGTQTDIVGPAGSGRFGTSVTVLPNGNIVVADPYYDAGGTTDVGAVYLYDGATGALISTLTGSTAGDRVGYDGVVVLSNGNYVVSSSPWSNGGVVGAGAATWGSGTTGISGVVTLTNSLVGSTVGDVVGVIVTALSNGNYVVLSPYWDNGGVADAGAATWGNGTMGISGVVSVTNSLVGSTANDYVGNDVTALSNGHYVVSSPKWDNGGVTDAGAVTWGDGTTGITGVVTLTNSLVGSTAYDHVGNDVTALSNGHYVVLSPYWDNSGVADSGAATWGNGTMGISGVVTLTNSLVGSTAYDYVGNDVTALSNGHYVVSSPDWDNGAAADAGAATWGNGTMGITGVVTLTNSLVGSTAYDWVGGDGVTALSNGNYVVLSPGWANGAVASAGAATWGNGTMGISGVVTLTNSLVGSTAYDYVGIDVKALSNGHYVVLSPGWDSGAAANAGAATWGNGTTGISGVVTLTNSLVGSTAGDNVGSHDVTALSNGNYVVCSPEWDNGGVTDAGAATWANGTTGTSGVVTVTNSLVGSAVNDYIGLDVTALSNGNYVVLSPGWANGAVANAGAATWGNGTTGISGVVSVTNSLVGSTADDQVGTSVTPLSNGHYVVFSPLWNSGVVTDSGAVTWGNGNSGTKGTITGENSVRGTAVSGGPALVFDYDYTHHQLVVGRPADNIVTLFIGEYVCYLPIVLRNAAP
jgi:hypothetical protein